MSEFFLFVGFAAAAGGVGMILAGLVLFAADVSEELRRRYYMWRLRRRFR